jgi:hypothetical protein
MGDLKEFAVLLIVMIIMVVVLSLGYVMFNPGNGITFNGGQDEITDHNKHVSKHIDKPTDHASRHNYQGGKHERPRRERRDKHIVIDTLNLVHWLYTTRKNPVTISMETIEKAINYTAPMLRKEFSGRIMYVVKDKESKLNDDETRKQYLAIATANKCYIVAAEKYSDSGPAKSKLHSALGRDDFMTVVLANRWKCPVLTYDKMRDFESYRKTLLPFHVYEYNYWREYPDREYIRPESTAYSRLKKPFIVPTEEYIEHPTPREITPV